MVLLHKNLALSYCSMQQMQSNSQHTIFSKPQSGFEHCFAFDDEVRLALSTQIEINGQFWVLTAVFPARVGYNFLQLFKLFVPTSPDKSPYSLHNHSKDKNHHSHMPNLRSTLVQTGHKTALLDQLLCNKGTCISSSVATPTSSNISTGQQPMPPRRPFPFLHSHLPPLHIYFLYWNS